MRVLIRRRDSGFGRAINRPTRLSPDLFQWDFCQDIVRQGNLIYLMRGGWVWRTIDKDDLVEVIN